MRIDTARLELIPATATSIRAEIGGAPALAALLGATVPDNWPPEQIAEALPWFLQKLEAASTDQIGWLCWYALAKSEPQELPVLIASGGFLGPPQQQSMSVELGYEVLPQFRGLGYATEMVGALVDWALAQTEVQRVVADVHPDNIPSIRLLRRLHFIEIGIRDDEPDKVQFQRTAEPGAA